MSARYVPTAKSSRMSITTAPLDDVAALRDGWNVDESGERYFYVSNPATGLWAYEGRFAGSEAGSEAGGASRAAGGVGREAKRQKI